MFNIKCKKIYRYQFIYTEICGFATGNWSEVLRSLQLRDIWLINFLLPPRRQWLVTRARQYFTGSGLEHMHGHTGLREILE